MKKRIVVIGIHGPYEPWKSILMNGQAETWMDSFPNLRIISVFGRGINQKLMKFDKWTYYLRWSEIKVVAYSALLFEMILKSTINLDRYRPNVIRSQNHKLGDIWEFQMPDSLMLQGVKNLAAFRESLNLEYDFLVTTISSSYLNLSLLKEFLEQVKPENFVGGRIEKSGDMKYQQGSFRVYSRDVVENLVSHSRHYKHWKIEDIAMGALTTSLYSEFTEMPNMTIQSVSDVENISNEELGRIISYRCKSTMNGARKDAEVMHSLHNRLFLEC